MRRALAALAALAAPLAAGCVLDFEQFRADASVDVSVVEDRPAPADVPVDLGPSDSGSPMVDAGPDVTDAPLVDAGCGEPGSARVRLAHMASGFGHVDLCMRRALAGVAFSNVDAMEWPSAGVGYRQVTQHVDTNTPVLVTNELWQFAVVPEGTVCAEVGTSREPLAVLNFRPEPRSLTTLLFSSQRGSAGLVGVLGALTDRPCGTCPAGTLDVRAVHASLASAAERLELSINYNTDPSTGPGLVNVIFATNVPYGGTAPVGGTGFDCDNAWWLASLLPEEERVQFAARAVGGGDVDVARSERVPLKGQLLRRSHMATLFFTGDGTPTSPPEFVLCYEGAHDAGMNVCDNVQALPMDAGARDAGTAGEVDAAAEPDAGW